MLEKRSKASAATGQTLRGGFRPASALWRNRQRAGDLRGRVTMWTGRETADSRRGPAPKGAASGNGWEPRPAMLRGPCQRKVKSDPPLAVFGKPRPAHTRREEGNRKRREVLEYATPGRLGTRSCQQRNQTMTQLAESRTQPLAQRIPGPRLSRGNQFLLNYAYYSPHYYTYIHYYL